MKDDSEIALKVLCGLDLCLLSPQDGIDCPHCNEYYDEKLNVYKPKNSKRYLVNRKSEPLLKRNKKLYDISCLDPKMHTLDNTMLDSHKNLSQLFDTSIKIPDSKNEQPPPAPVTSLTSSEKRYSDCLLSTNDEDTRSLSFYSSDGTFFTEEKDYSLNEMLTKKYCFNTRKDSIIYRKEIYEMNNNSTQTFSTSSDSEMDNEKSLSDTYDLFKLPNRLAPKAENSISKEIPNLENSASDMIQSVYQPKRTPNLSRQRYKFGRTNNHTVLMRSLSSISNMTEIFEESMSDLYQNIKLIDKKLDLVLNKFTSTTNEIKIKIEYEFLKLRLDMLTKTKSEDAESKLKKELNKTMDDLSQQLGMFELDKNQDTNKKLVDIAESEADCSSHNTSARFFSFEFAHKNQKHVRKARKKLSRQQNCGRQTSLPNEYKKTILNKSSFASLKLDEKKKNYKEDCSLQNMLPVLIVNSTPLAKNETSLICENFDPSKPLSAPCVNTNENIELKHNANEKKSISYFHSPSSFLNPDFKSLQKKKSRRISLQPAMMSDFSVNKKYGKQKSKVEIVINHADDTS